MVHFPSIKGNKHNTENVNLLPGLFYGFQTFSKTELNKMKFPRQNNGAEEFEPQTIYFPHAFTIQTITFQPLQNSVSNLLHFSSCFIFSNSTGSAVKISFQYRRHYFHLHYLLNF